MTPTGLGPKEPMPENELSRQELIDWIDTRDPFGVDVEGRKHYWFPARQLVAVERDGDLVYRVDVANLERWKDFVDDRVGWKWNRWSDKTFVEMIADSVRCA